MIILLSLTSLHLQWKKSLDVLHFTHDLSYNSSEVTVVEYCQIPPHTHTHTKIETSSREFPDVLFFECDDICLHWKLDTGFFSLETVSETHFPHWFCSIWHAYEQLNIFNVWETDEEFLM